MRAFLAAIAVASILSIFASLTLRAHEGHSHDNEPVQTGPVNPSAPRAAASSDQFEIVVVARDRWLEIYVDSFVTNEPIGNAAIEIETPDGPATAKALPNQTYRLEAPWLQKSRSVDLVVTINANGVTDILPLTISTKTAGSVNDARKDEGSWLRRLLPVGIAVIAVSLIVLVSRLWTRSRATTAILVCLALLSGIQTSAWAHDGHDHGDTPQQSAAPVGETSQRLPDGRLFVPKAVQRVFALRSVMTETKPYRRRVELPGRIIPDPNASGFVQAAVGGRLAPPPNGFPRLGTIVKQGDILAYVTPPLQAIDVSDMRQRRGEIDQQIAIVQDRLARFQTLLPSGAIARSQVEETRIELEGLKDRRTLLERSQREPEALVAPVSGAIAEGSAVAGQIVQPSAVVFQIIDPDRLWVEALSFESITATSGAIAMTSQGATLELDFRGSGLADRSQSIPVHFAIAKNVARIRVGQFVNVTVPVEDERSGLTIPRSSIVRAPGGGDMVFEHTGAETFTPRPVRVEPLDAANVLVSSGLESGRRIVTQGAELLDHVR